MTHPATYFTDMLTLPAFSPAPKEFLDHVPANLDFAKHTLSDGPYQVQTYIPTKQIAFVRNQAWNAKVDPIRKAYVDKIVIDETVTQESAQQQLETGTASADMEFDDFPPASTLPALIAKHDPNLNLGLTVSSNPYVVFNLASGAMGKLEVRQALMYAINRADIIQAPGGPKVNPPLTQVLPPNLLGSKDSDLQVPSVAKRGVWDLSLAGWQADWYGNGALSFFAPLFSGAPSYPPSGSDFGFYDSPATNALLGQAAAAPTVRQAESLWAKADEQVMKDAPFYPITNPVQPNYHASQVHNAIYVPAIQNFDPTNVWLDRTEQGG